MSGDLLIRDVEVEDRPGVDVRVAGGRIVEIGPGLSGREPDLDGRGGALLPGLIDHHIHLFGLAAQAASVELDGQTSIEGIGRALRAKAGELSPGAWLRGVGYHEAGGEPLDRASLDIMVADRPVRIQHRTGGLWILNSAALDEVADGATPPCVERDDQGEPTGRIWRGDDWLRGRLAQSPPSLAGVSAALARRGVTGVTDASVTNDPAQADVFARAIAAGEWRQRLMLMGGGFLEAPADGAFQVGPVKVLLDDDRLPDLDAVCATIARARDWGRKVAIHCVAAGELAFALAAFGLAGAEPGDRIEHGGIIHPDAAREIARLGLTVVTQPGFVAERGDRYLAEVDPTDLAALYPCASLMRAGIKVAGSSDAPYAAADPWAAMSAAINRTTLSGRLLGSDERVAPRAALNMFLGDFADPGGDRRRVEVGAAADLCLLRCPLDVALAAPDASWVAATVVGGEVIHRA
ncbi:amidohydrolase family protein [Phenylobacterium sp.]|uniref:amidohydrolase family protein n=1 Tax=Phenylobacterium sp. TaxID=1871053 RepID=UPI002FC62017